MNKEYNVDRPNVSILCTSYNHEKYIADALNGFLMQETDFSYEIIVHDDASTDSTQSIIKKYCQDYPNRIVAILQNKNQYSQGRKITKDFLLPRARGKYIALCEGDDYWTDPHKLQIQYEYMERHPECMMCAHANRLITAEGLEKGVARYRNNDADITISDCLSLASTPVQTATYFIRKSLYLNLSEAYFLCPVGDYSLCVEAAMIYPIHYVDKTMSAYRVLTPESWTYRMRNSLQLRVQLYQKYTRYYKALLRVIPEQEQLIKQKLLKCSFLENVCSNNLKSAFSSKYYRDLRFISKIRYQIMGRNPKLYFIIKDLLYYTKIKDKITQ